MGAHGVGGGVGIALLDFIENDLMLLQGKFLPAPRIEQAAHPVEAKSRGFGNGLDALEAIQRRGPIVGLGKAAWRIVRCNPLCKGGYDPVDGCRHDLRLDAAEPQPGQR